MGSSYKNSVLNGRSSQVKIEHAMVTHLLFPKSIQ